MDRIFDRWSQYCIQWEILHPLIRCLCSVENLHYLFFLDSLFIKAAHCFLKCQRKKDNNPFYVLPLLLTFAMTMLGFVLTEEDWNFSDTDSIFVADYVKRERTPKYVECLIIPPNQHGLKHDPVRPREPGPNCFVGSFPLVKILYNKFCVTHNGLRFTGDLSSGWSIFWSGVFLSHFFK